MIPKGKFLVAPALAKRMREQGLWDDDLYVEGRVIQRKENEDERVPPRQFLPSL